MTLSRPSLVILATAGSAGLIVGALLFQYVGGMAPCEMCYWQRWPHYAALIIGPLALMVPGRLFPLLGALATATSGGLGIYHTGVERGWWPGPTSCTGAGDTGLGSLSGSDLLSTAAPTNVVMCDQVAWEMFGLSMASWNAIVSLSLALIWIWAARNRV